MPQHKFKSKIYRFQPYIQTDSRPSTIQISPNSQRNLHYDNNNSSDNLNSTSPSILQSLNADADSLQPWRPSTRLRKLHTQFQNTILCQHICIPCVFCTKLLYPSKAKWIPYNENYTYPLELNIQNSNIYLRSGGSACNVCICESCKNNRK